MSRGNSRRRKNLDDNNETEADCHLAGPRSALGSAIGCGILLGVFEGMLLQQSYMERRS